MRRLGAYGGSRLFWKILLGFWLTFLLMLQGVWMAYAVMWGERESYDWSVAQIVAPYQLSAARLAIEAGGLTRLEQVSQDWEGHEWNRLSVTEAGAAEPPPDGSGGVSIEATDPEARVWRLNYTMPAEKWRDSYRDHSYSWLYLPLEWAIPAGLGGLLFSAGLAWYLARPIELLRRGFRKLADGQFSTRLRPGVGRRRDEIADLARDFDRMAERLQQLIDARDRLLHDVSHELRSPLARLNLAAALAGREGGCAKDALRRIETEVARLDRLVGELLSLSRRESGTAEVDTYFDLRDLTDTVLADARFEAEARKIAIEFRDRDTHRALIQGDAELIRRALDNVVRNAVQHSAAGDRIEVGLRLDNATRSVTLEVADRGPGVPDSDLERMAEPFVRLSAAQSRQGYGLGLAIARRALHSHGGTLHFANRAGGGLLATLSLPLADVASHLADPAFDEEN
ncbi:integral membrane sensor signal transduction histidine kinase [Thauera linaloolentis 47Lol = DSM 12138]|uniref:histidine kinase n=1 Tax=Thauera linaloolentis (strain DSM 12138 / JCM 21573 / CCUG 41526 / CIP 105981 / IAM 15112 / NBRC 102519 / 47Lol) TaxID=1123367 RepID=N6XYU0_THAL4|nr:integral membrane sensor signal transduction histidine kinase [Thauera linaloolentis 47Lol = DSM 12138]